jgi:hypothetical protein
VSFVCFFENGIKERSLTEFTLSIFLEGFEMTRIVIFILCGQVQLMIHFVVNTSPSKPCAFVHFPADIASSPVRCGSPRRDLLVERVFD